MVDTAKRLAGMEITPEMIDAGVSVFVRFDPAGDLATETVAEIFQAMIEARDLRQAKKPQGEPQFHQSPEQSLEASPN